MTYEAVVFDVLGTVVDEESARRQAIATLFGSANADGNGVEPFTEAWEALETEWIGAVASENRAWATCDDMRAEALHDVASRHPEILFSTDALTRAALFGRDIQPWADSVHAINALHASCPVFALTNGSAPTMAEMSRRTGLNWTELISADEVETFKPNARMYERPRVRVNVDPRRTLFVAAHPWDLDGAKLHGYKTALVLRPGVIAQSGYDHVVQDLNGIAALFAAAPG